MLPFSSKRIGVIFDLDGILVDSMADLTNSLNQFLTLHDYPPVSQAEVGRMMGDGAPELLSRAIAVHGDSINAAEIDQLSPQFLALYHASDHSLTRLYPGVKEVLEQLAQADCRMAICTNKYRDPALKILRRLGVDGYFRGVVGGETTGAHKPDPRPLAAALTLIDCHPAQAAMVGDSINDISMARKAGVFAIGCRYGFPRTPTDLDTADAIIDDVRDLLFVLSANNP